MELSDRVNGVINAALGSRIVGCVALVNQNGRQVFARAAGMADREADRPATLNSIFRLASVTKPIVAATALRMMDLGLLSLDDRVADYLPYFTPKAPDGSTPDITIRHLLTHTSGLTYDGVPDDVSRGSDPRDLMPLTENLRRLARAPLAFAPGTAWQYGMSIDVLGGVLAAINKSDLEGVVAAYVTGPLCMDDTHFSVTDPARLAYPYGDGSPPFRMAEPQNMTDQFGTQEFSPKRIFQRNAPQSGGSGMAGTAGDLMKLFDAIRTGTVLAPATRDAAFTNQIGELDRPRDPGQKFGFLGAVIDNPAASGWPTRGMLHWGGIWGNNWIINPATGTVVVVCTNTMYEGCNGPFREQVRDAVFGQG